MSVRDNFSQPTKRKLQDAVGGFCSNPDCMRPTTARSQHSVGYGISNAGVAAHIHAAAEGGARFKSDQTKQERKSADNGIWLCRFCATKIDNNDGIDFPSELLRQWKLKAETLARQRFKQGIPPREQTWTKSISSAIYANIPRIIQRMDLSEEFLEDISPLSRGIPDGFIAPYLSILGKAIDSFELEATPLILGEKIAEDWIGRIVAFNSNVRTKNGSEAQKRDIDQSLLTSFDPLKSPHFYIGNKNGPRWVFPYDPKWVLTTTSFVELSSGQARLAGIGLVKRVEKDGLQGFVSPLLIGFPKYEAYDLEDIL